MSNLRRYKTYLRGIIKIKTGKSPMKHKRNSQQKKTSKVITFILSCELLNKI
jgi:hypothetical protein